MQSLCNYSMSVEGVSIEVIDDLYVRVECAVTDWLTHKGAAEPTADVGSFTSQTHEAQGAFKRHTLNSDVSSLLEVFLEEPTRSGQSFLTKLSVVKGGGKLIVFISQSVQSTSPQLLPVVVDAKCPKIVRKILDLTTDWQFGGFPLPQQKCLVVRGQDAGLELGRKIKDGSRALPIIVVSEIEGQGVWAEIADELAFDLAGLAFVAAVDDDASWALTETVGKINSCYRGAIRLYWPVPVIDESPFKSTVWTASHLLSDDVDGKGSFRFRSSVRKLIMSVAAVSFDVPMEVKAVYRYEMNQKLRELEEKATENSEELKLAKMYFEDNEALRNQIDDLTKERNQWASRAQSAEYALEQKAATSSEQPVTEVDENNFDQPVPGEERFFKKTHSTPGYDVLVQVKDCGHNAWQDSHKGDKARKGLLRIKLHDWKSLHHCAKCDGGGLWRVRW